MKPRKFRVTVEATVIEEESIQYLGETTKQHLEIIFSSPNCEHFKFSKPKVEEISHKRR